MSALAAAPVPAARDARGHVSYTKAVAALGDVGRMFWLRGWLPGTGGNFSVVLDDDPLRLAVTATGADKSRLAARDVLVVDADSTVVQGDGRPSAEVALHQAVIAACPGAGAVLHTHSLAAIEASLLAGDAIELTGLEQLKALEGAGSPEHRERLPVLDNDQDVERLARRCTPLLASGEHHGLLLRGHGIYAWGRDLRAARRHLETYEHLLELRLRLWNANRGGPRGHAAHPG